jgi:predicted RNase H-like HicB family nuclease
MGVRFYRAIAFQSPGDRANDGWDVIFPDLPGCVSQGDSPQAAMENAMEALALHIEGMVAEGETLPTPSAVTDPLPNWVPQREIGARFEAFLTAQIPDSSPENAPHREAV